MLEPVQLNWDHPEFQSKLEAQRWTSVCAGGNLEKPRRRYIAIISYTISFNASFSAS